MKKHISLKSDHIIKVSTSDQTLTLIGQNGLIETYDVSTSRFGTGEEYNSNKTPRGVHVIFAKIGADYPLGTVFAGRKAVGQIVPPDSQSGENDFITSRILRLAGLEDFNRTTFERHIYIHGTVHEKLIGTPASHGCIRMRNKDIISLFKIVPPWTIVEIE